MPDWLIRTRMLTGEDALKRLSGKRVAVFGLGGVGGHAAEAVARAGVGHLLLVDNDTVSESNLNRQLCALRSTIGKRKTDVMRERLLDVNPELDIDARTAFYDAQSAGSFFDWRPDYIVDAIDTVSSKIDLIVRAHTLNVAIVSSMGTGNRLSAAGFVEGDIFETKGCPLARVLRKELKERGISSHRVIYSPEPALSPEPLEQPTPPRRSVPGSISFVPPVSGLLMAGVVIRNLLSE